MSTVTQQISSGAVELVAQGLTASDKRRQRCAISGRTLVGDDSMSLGHRLKLRSNASFDFVDVSTMSGVDRRVDPDNVGDIAGEGAGHRG
jgi:hypothetical protein